MIMKRPVILFILCIMFSSCIVYRNTMPEYIVDRGNTYIDTFDLPRSERDLGCFYKSHSIVLLCKQIKSKYYHENSRNNKNNLDVFNVELINDSVWHITLTSVDGSKKKFKYAGGVGVYVRRDDGKILHFIGWK